MMTDDLDSCMDMIAALPGDDAVAVLRKILDAVNNKGTDYEHRLAVIEAVVSALNAACARRAERTLQ